MNTRPTISLSMVLPGRHARLQAVGASGRASPFFIPRPSSPGTHATGRFEVHFDISTDEGHAQPANKITLIVSEKVTP